VEKAEKNSEVGEKVGWQSPAFVPILGRPHAAPCLFGDKAQKSR
jgi:hypothetical protein